MAATCEKYNLELRLGLYLDIFKQNSCFIWFCDVVIPNKYISIYACLLSIHMQALGVRALERKH